MPAVYIPEHFIRCSLRLIGYGSLLSLLASVSNFHAVTHGKPRNLF